MYSTTDLYLAAALQEAGHHLVSVWKDGSRSTFDFEDSPSVQASIGGYFSDQLQLRAHGFAERIRSAKSMAVNAPLREASKK